MLTNMEQAKSFMYETVAKYQPLEEVETDILDTLLEETFSDKIEWLVSDQEIEEMKFESEEALDAYLFHKIPNYTTLLEESVAEVIADYLVEDKEENNQI